MAAHDLQPERIVRLEPDAVVVLDQRRLPDEEVELRCALGGRGRGRDSHARRSAARPRSAWRPRTDSRSPRCAGRTSTRPTTCSRRRGRPRSISAGRSTSSVTIRRRSARARSTRRRSSAVAGWGSTPPSSTRARGAAPDALQHRRAGDRRLRVGARRRARGLGGRARRARLGGRDAAAAPGRTPDGMGARRAGYPVLRDRGRSSGVAHGRGRGRRRASPAPTGSRRTATWRTRSGRTASRSRPAHHGVPFYVVAPTSTLDPSAASGADIPIEERDPREVSTRFPATEPGVRRHARRAGRRDRDRGRRASRAVRVVASDPGAKRPLMDVDRETAVVLERFGFDEALFESLRARVAAGELSPESNLIRGSIEPPRRGRRHTRSRLRATPDTTRCGRPVSTRCAEARSRRSSSPAGWRRASAAS